MSEFAFEAARLDGGDHGKYWSKPREMAARAFQGWCEDRLAGQGRRNDYLSSMADNRYYRLLDQRPFPEGEERERINAALDGLMAALRDTGTLAKAFGLLKAA
nr:LPD1 domain-containing protein [Methylomagnum ishizawai]